MLIYLPWIEFVECIAIVSTGALVVPRLRFGDGHDDDVVVAAAGKIVVVVVGHLDGRQKRIHRM